MLTYEAVRESARNCIQPRTPPQKKVCSFAVQKRSGAALHSHLIRKHSRRQCSRYQCKHHNALRPFTSALRSTEHDQSNIIRRLTGTSERNFGFHTTLVIMVAMGERLGIAIRNSMGEAMACDMTTKATRDVGQSLPEKRTDAETFRYGSCPGHVTNEMGHLQVAKLFSHNSIAESNTTQITRE